MADDRRVKRQEDWHSYVDDTNQSWRTTPDQVPAGVSLRRKHADEQAQYAAVVRASDPLKKGGATATASPRKDFLKKKAPVSGQATPRGRPSAARRTGAASPARRTASSPSRRKKSPGRQKKGAAGTPAPHEPLAYRDASAFQPATGSHGLVSHQALPAEAGMSLVQAVRAGAASGQPGLMVDPASHTATITAAMGGQIQELRAALTAEQTSSLQAQRASTLSEIALLETLLAERRRDMTALDEALAGLVPPPRKGAAGGAKSAGGGGRARSPGRATSPKRSSSKGRAKSPPHGR